MTVSPEVQKEYTPQNFSKKWSRNIVGERRVALEDGSVQEYSAYEVCAQLTNRAGREELAQFILDALASGYSLAENPIFVRDVADPKPGDGWRRADASLVFLTKQTSLGEPQVE